jgi:serine/threonine-protein kinase
MQLVRGGSCSDWVRTKGPMSEAQASYIAAEAARGLEAVHAAGMIHRDIKPGNLMLTDDGSVKIADFRLAKSLASDGADLTHTGEIVGAPHYMSPGSARANRSTGAATCTAWGRRTITC